MATDIAFSLGVLALIGSRAPLSLKIFLTAFAIVDDIGAITVIAVFYTEYISWANLGVGLALLLLLVVLNVSGVTNTLVYFIVSVLVWIAFFESGIHATISGVLIAMTIPMKVRIDTQQFVRPRQNADGHLRARRAGHHPARTLRADDYETAWRTGGA